MKCFSLIEVFEKEQTSSPLTLLKVDPGEIWLKQTKSDTDSREELGEVVGVRRAGAHGARPSTESALRWLTSSKRQTNHSFRALPFSCSFREYPSEFIPAASSP